MEDKYILAIESSCDETSIAILKNGYEVVNEVTNTQIEHFKEIGGVVPEMASRMHANNIFYVYDEVFKNTNLTIKNISCICVTQGPGLIGALIVGVNFAKTLSMLHNIPLVGVNHIMGHIKAIKLQTKMEFPHLSLVISGGHTELIYFEDESNYKKIGQTLDDAVGESYDKVARLLKLPYPGGPEIDKLAKSGKAIYDLPLPKNDNTLDFSFSGLKSACFNFINSANMKGQEVSKEDFSASFQEVVVTTLYNKFDLAYNKYKIKQCSIVGGVSANTKVREVFLSKYDNLIIPDIKYSTDNGAMIGVVGYDEYLKNNFCDILEFDAKTNMKF